MSDTSEDLIREKLKAYIITRETHPKVPESLDGEILLAAYPHGWVTVSVPSFVKVWEDVLKDHTKPKKLQAMKANPERGYNEFIDKWLKEGIDF